jgi:hypothetical protein
VRELGLDAYIVKPVRRAALLETISTALAERGRTTVGTLLANPAQSASGDLPATPDHAANARASPAPSEKAGVHRPTRIRLPDDCADNRLLVKI